MFLKFARHFLITIFDGRGRFYNMDSNEWTSDFFIYQKHYMRDTACIFDLF